jgi:hypothetical protein
MTLDLSERRVSALDAARDDGDYENDDVEDNALVLTRDQLQQVDEFRNLLDRADDADKFELCAEKCNELLRHDTRLQILIAAYDGCLSRVRKQKAAEDQREDAIAK